MEENTFETQLEGGRRKGDVNHEYVEICERQHPDLKVLLQTGQARLSLI